MTGILTGNAVAPGPSLLPSPALLPNLDQKAAPELRRRYRVAMKLELENSTRRQFNRIGITEGTFSYGTAHRMFDWGEEADNGGGIIVTQDYDVAFGLAAIGLLTEIVPPVV